MTSPIACASAASTNRPVRIISIARPVPTSRASRWVPPAPGSTDRVVSGSPNRAFSDAIRMSHAIASSQPPPRANPLTAATVGFGKASTASKVRCISASSPVCRS